MTLNPVLLGAILFAIVGGGIFLYRVLLAITKLLEAVIMVLEQTNSKLLSSPLLTRLLSI
jgi:hypothetical protein